MLTFLYITLFFNSLESPFSGRPGHVPWREVSSHLIALILGIYKKALYHPHPNLFLGPDVSGNGGIRL